MGQAAQAAGSESSRIEHSGYVNIRSYLGPFRNLHKLRQLRVLVDLLCKFGR